MSFKHFINNNKKTRVTNNKKFRRHANATQRKIQILYRYRSLPKHMRNEENPARQDSQYCQKKSHATPYLGEACAVVK